MSGPSTTFVAELPQNETPPMPRDEDLVRDALAGDELAFRLLYRCHTPRVLGLVQRLLGRESSDADDVLQTVWLRAMHGVADFNWNSTLNTWLCGIAVRASLETLRAVRGRTTVSLDDTGVAAAGSADIASRLDIDDAIAAVPQHYRVVFVLHDVEGFTHEEIAEQLAIPLGTSKANLHRARRLLRAKLGTYIEGHDP
jgi:RNA polymerase sigma-70 factor (ECF subfamily)